MRTVKEFWWLARRFYAEHWRGYLIGTIGAMLVLLGWSYFVMRPRNELYGGEIPFKEFRILDVSSHNLIVWVVLFVVVSACVRVNFLPYCRRDKMGLDNLLPTPSPLKFMFGYLNAVVGAAVITAVAVGVWMPVEIAILKSYGVINGDTLLHFYALKEYFVILVIFATPFVLVFCWGGVRNYVWAVCLVLVGAILLFFINEHATGGGLGHYLLRVPDAEFGCNANEVFITGSESYFRAYFQQGSLAPYKAIKLGVLQKILFATLLLASYFKFRERSIN